MALEAKICGLSTAETVDLAVAEGAALVGFNFFPRSPRYVSIAAAAALAHRVRPGVRRVAVLVDPSDDFLAELVARVPLELLQLHGQETPKRVAEVTEKTGLPVMKVISVADDADLDAVGAYEPVVERLMLDAKPPAAMKNALPGGNALAFDWKLLAGHHFRRPWMLAGGLTPENLKEATSISGARRVDVSSGVESAPGRKDPDK
ncbi:MAG TPA: phosphoribosylanthranilate isomerase, partial [Kiloniellales bacterium]|nr:phosphoribosylanthranilate isomerase [Kiloniellales bacterium]